MKTIACLLLLWPYCVCAQTTLQLTTMCNLPPALAESSGLAITNKGHLFWTHNDSGGQPILYGMDSIGNIRRQVNILNARNVDWEDLAKDRAGQIYIGDFGNNNNDRRDLKIYIIPNPDQSSGASLSAQTISFTYPDQEAFPPSNKLKNYDTEAFFWFKDSLYLFSKDRTSPYHSYTKMYRLPAKAGDYEAVLVDSFYTAQSSWYFSITSADISPDGSKMALLNSDKLWIFHHFSGADFFHGEHTLYQLSSFSQKEAVCFRGNNLFITDERFAGVPAHLYKVLLPGSINSSEPNEDIRFFYTSLTRTNGGYLEWFLPCEGKLTISLTTTDGNIINLIDNQDAASGFGNLRISKEHLIGEAFVSLFFNGQLVKTIAVNI